VLFRVGLLPNTALAASARFHAEVLPRLLEIMPRHGCMTLAFLPADHAHRAWRTAVVQGLAREHVPVRINAVESRDEASIAETCAYLDQAPGVTGQYWPLDGCGAEVV